METEQDQDKSSDEIYGAGQIFEDDEDSESIKSKKMIIMRNAKKNEWERVPYSLSPKYQKIIKQRILISKKESPVMNIVIQKKLH